MCWRKMELSELWGVFETTSDRFGQLRYVADIL
jgi:hypothetical protein